MQIKVNSLNNSVTSWISKNSLQLATGRTVGVYHMAHANPAKENMQDTWSHGEHLQHKQERMCPSLL